MPLFGLVLAGCHLPSEVPPEATPTELKAFSQTLSAYRAAGLPWKENPPPNSNARDEDNAATYLLAASQKLNAVTASADLPDLSAADYPRFLIQADNLKTAGLKGPLIDLLLEAGIKNRLDFHQPECYDLVAHLPELKTIPFFVELLCKGAKDEAVKDNGPQAARLLNAAWHISQLMGDMPFMNAYEASLEARLFVDVSVEKCAALLCPPHRSNHWEGHYLPT